MAIKVKHDVNAAPVAVASAQGGRARRQVETAKLYGGGARGGGGGTGGGARAGAVSPHVPNAPTTHAQLISQGPGRNYDAERKAQREAQEFRADEAEKERAWRGGQAEADRAWRTDEREAGERFRAGQAEADRAWRTDEREGAQDHAIDLEELREDHRIDADERKQARWEYQQQRLKENRDADLIAAGTHEYGYSPTAQKEVDRINAEYEKAVMDKRFTKAQLEDLKKQRDANIAAIPTTRRKSPEEQFRESMVFGNRDNGLPEGAVFDPQTRKLVVDPNAQMELQARREERVQDRQDRLAAQEEQRYVNAYLALQRQGKMVDGLREELTPDEIEKALRPLFPNRFANVQPGSAGAQPVPAQPAPAPTTQPTAQPTAQTSTAANEPEWKKKLGW